MPVNIPSDGSSEPSCAAGRLRRSVPRVSFHLPLALAFYARQASCNAKRYADQLNI